MRLEDVRDEIRALLRRQLRSGCRVRRHRVADLDEQRRQRLHPELARERVAGQRRRLGAGECRAVAAGAALRVERLAASRLRVAEDAVLHGARSLRVDGG